MATTLRQVQDTIFALYGSKDARRGVEGTFMWFLEEVGELAGALRSGDAANLEEEFADVLAWLATLANLAGVDLERAIVAKHLSGCPKCRAIPCGCDQGTKP